MFTTGFAIFLGLVFIAIKLPRCTMLRWLRYDVVLDVAVTLIVLAIHFGTFSSTDAVQITRVPPQVIRADPAAVEMNPGSMVTGLSSPGARPSFLAVLTGVPPIRVRSARRRRAAVAGSARRAP